MSFLKNVSDAVNKRICRFLIHRYLGEVLKEKVRLDQLSVNLYQGTGTISGLNVDAKFVNDCLELAKVPIRLVDGYIGEVTIHIPWGKLQEDSCQFLVKGLEITLQPQPDFATSTAPDLMASMLESMVGSLASSVDLARSFLSEDPDGDGADSTDNGNPEEGVEAFAQLIDAILARMRLSFTDTIVRLESVPKTTDKAGGGRVPQSDLGIALEVQIDELEFIDEQLESCRQTGDSAEPITTQPHSLYTVPDLNKVLYLKGVRLYTDIFSKPENCPNSGLGLDEDFDEASNGGVLTRRVINWSPAWKSYFSAMKDHSFVKQELWLSRLGNIVQLGSSYFLLNAANRLLVIETIPLNRGHNTYTYTTTNKCWKDTSQIDASGILSPSSSVFQSCLSTVPEPLADDLGSLGNSFVSSVNNDTKQRKHSQPPSTDWIPSNPVKFAQLYGEKQVIQFRLRNPLFATDNNAGACRKLDIEMFLGAMHIILSPTQIFLLTQILETILTPSEKDGWEGKGGGRIAGEKKMGEEDFALVEKQLQTALQPQDLWRTDMGTGNWSGEEHFFTTSSRPSRMKPTSDQQNADSSPTPDEGVFTSIMMNEPSSSCQTGPDLIQELQIDCDSTSNKKHAFSEKSPHERPEVTHCKARLGSLWVTVTHQDPFASHSKILDATSLLQEWSQNFFQKCVEVGLHSRSSSLKQMRQSCDEAFDRDHLRFVGCPTTIDLTLERASSSENLTVTLTSATCELLECLSKDSVLPSSNEFQSGTMTQRNIDSLHHVEMACFHSEDATKEKNNSVPGNWHGEPDLTLTFRNHGRTHYKLGLELAACKSELDMSVLDRLHNILHCQPNFLKQKQNAGASLFEIPASSLHQATLTTAQSDNQTHLELREDLFQPMLGGGGGGPSPTVLRMGGGKEGEQLFSLPLGVTEESNESDISSKTTLEVDLKCPEWTVEVAIPVADLRDATGPSCRTPWWVRRVRPEKLRLSLQNAHLKVPILSSNSEREGEVILTATEAEGTFLQQHLDSNEPFLYASGMKGLEKCSLKFKWDFTNRSLEVEKRGGGSGSRGGEDSGGSWGSCFQFPKSMDGPFSKEHVIHENEQLILVGNKEELEKFSAQCKSYTELDISIDLPQLRVFLPGREFYELLYNRLVNDLAMWEPSSPSYQSPQVSASAAMSQYYSIHVAGLSDNDRFILCKSAVQHYDSDADSEEEGSGGGEASGGGAGGGRRPTANRISFSLKSAKTRALLLTPTEGKEDQQGELSLAGRNGELFLVAGYQGNPNVAYMYVRMAQIWLWHQTVYSRNVSEAGFGSSVDSDETDICGEPTPETLAVTVSNNDNFAVGLRLELKPAANTKEILATVGVRNTTMHFHPLGNTVDFWLMQLIDFFNVTDYPIEGYEMPRVLTELHTHAWSSTILYRHAEIDPTNPSSLQDSKATTGQELRVWLENADMSSYIVQDAKALRFHCLFEDSRIYLREWVFDGTPVWSRELTDFVSLLKTGLFEVEVLVSDEMLSSSSETNDLTQKPINQKQKPRTRPVLEVRVKNDLVRLWTCADSLASVTRVIQKIMDQSTPNTTSESTETIKNCDMQSKNDQPCTVENGGCATRPRNIQEPDVPTQQRSELTLSDEEELKDMVESAMRETTASGPIAVPKKCVQESLSLPPSYSSDDVKLDLEDAMGEGGGDVPGVSQEKGRSSTDEEYCIVDELPGSGIKSPSGEPRITHYGEEAVGSVENHFKAPPSRNDPITSLPEGYPQPFMRYLIRDFSVLWHIYGGADYSSDVLSCTRAYSERYGGSSNSRRLRKTPVPSPGTDGRGGKDRDYGVLIELHLSKICFLYELFDRDAPAFSRQVLTIQDIEIRDRLALSQINKVLYQYASEKKPRQTQTPMVSLRLLEMVPKEAKLKLSMLPLRVNLDQDTLEFVQDFATDFVQGLANELSETKPNPVDTPIPILKMPSRNKVSGDWLSGVTPSTSNSSIPSDILFGDSSHTTKDQLLLSDYHNEHEHVAYSNHIGNSAPIATVPPASNSADAVSLTESVSTLAGFFGETEDLNQESSAAHTSNDGEAAEFAQHHSPSKLYSATGSGSQFAAEEDSVTVNGTTTVRFSKNTTSFHAATPNSERLYANNEGRQQEMFDMEPIKSLDSDLKSAFEKSDLSGADSMFFKSFTFAPALVIRLDYQGKRRFDAGKQGRSVQGLLLGLSQLHCTELCLKELSYRGGVLGVEKILLLAQKEWLGDIVKNQLPQVVGSVGPISSFTQVAQGIRDLFWLPVEEYRKEGHLVKGIQRGAESFGLSTASAAVDLTQRVVGLLQGAAELAFDIVTPEYPAPRKMQDPFKALKRPTDFREGLGMAYDDVREGVSETAEVLQLAVAEEVAQGRWVGRGLLRQVTPTIIRPLLVASRATGHLLGGIRSQLKPESIREEQDKWRITSD